MEAYKWQAAELSRLVESPLSSRSLHHSLTVNMLLRVIISLCALTLAVADAVVIQGPNAKGKPVYYRLPNHTRPLLYDLKLNPHLEPDDFTFDGEVLIDIEILSRTRTLTLHSRHLMMRENATVLRVGRDESDFRVPVTHNRDNLTETLNLAFDEELPVGYYSLYLKFAGTLNDKPYGFYRSSYTDEAGDTVWFAVTNFVATHARAAFPCWDEPALKAAFKIAIKHRRDYAALSNTPMSVSEIDESIDNEVWTRFAQSPVMSTYLVGFLVSDFCNISNRDGSINVWARSSTISAAGFVHEVAQQAAIELERYTNGTIRPPKIDHVALPGLSNKAVESWGLVTYREATMMYSEGNSMETLRKIADNVILQSAHQWFGNAVTPSWWTNVWMNGGLAEYLKYHVFDKIHDNRQFKQFHLTRMMNLMLLVDSFDNARPLNFEPTSVREIDSKFYPYYENHKASLLLRMLSHCLTEDVFHAGLVKYLDKHKYSVVEPDDLWSALQDALDKSAGLPRDPPKFNIRDVMDTWIGQKGHPLVTVTRNHQTGRTTFTQEYFRPYEKFSRRRNTSKTDAVEARWWIPINFATHSNPDFSSTLPVAWLSPEVDELVITSGTASQDWIIVNVQHMGFYHVNYDTTNWLRIADYLDSENYEKVHPWNRAQLINDAKYLMFADKLEPEIFMSITRYLRRETDYTAWYPLFEILEEALEFFAYNDGGDLLKPYVLDLMNNVVNSLGVRDRPNDDYLTKVMRHGILERACACDHPTCLREAHAQLIAYLERPNELTNSTSFHKKQWLFCNGVKLANESVWYKLLRMYTRHSEPTINCLGYSKNLTIIENFLSMIVSEDSPIPKKNIYHVFDSILNAGYPNIDVVIDFIANHWNNFTAIYSLDDATDLLYYVSWRAISKKQIRKIKALMDKFNLEISDVVTTQEKNLDLAETIVNKIRLWLKRKSSMLPATSTPQ